MSHSQITLMADMYLRYDVFSVFHYFEMYKTYLTLFAITWFWYLDIWWFWLLF